MRRPLWPGRRFAGDASFFLRRRIIRPRRTARLRNHFGRGDFLTLLLPLVAAIIVTAIKGRHQSGHNQHRSPTNSFPLVSQFKRTKNTSLTFYGRFTVSTLNHEGDGAFVERARPHMAPGIKRAPSSICRMTRTKGERKKQRDD